MIYIVSYIIFILFILLLIYLIFTTITVPFRSLDNTEIFYFSIIFIITLLSYIVQKKLNVEKKTKMKRVVWVIILVAGIMLGIKWHNNWCEYINVGWGSEYSDRDSLSCKTFGIIKGGSKSELPL